MLLSIIFFFVSITISRGFDICKSIRPKFSALIRRTTKLSTSTLLTDLEKYDSVKEVPGGVFVDEEDLLSKSDFAIKPPDLIRLSKRLLVNEVGMLNEDLLADNFEFCAPFVGPLKKEEYLGALRNFQLLKAFPDMNNQFHFMRVDPFQPNRVWWHTRAKATHSAPLMGKAPTNKKLELPPQANSFIFNSEGKLQEITIGYVLDRRIGNTGGLGGAFGYLYGVGTPLPFPECQPYKKSWQFSLFSFVGALAQKIAKWFQKK
mmetsp:Transcript_28196/g.38782  ORF Transcript_28196/g.38782 Transcript_28196/m.38782 type:complete len:261 (+) Transcript_28196:14-796(+)